MQPKKAQSSASDEYWQQLIVDRNYGHFNSTTRKFHWGPPSKGATRQATKGQLDADRK
jgi:hypothetical protein